MFQLGSPKPVTIELLAAIGDRPAVKATFNARPSPLSLRAARRAVIDIMREGGSDAEERAGDAFTNSIIRYNLLSWEGIGNAEGEPVEPTADREIHDGGELLRIEAGTISAFLSEPRLVEAADRGYVMPWAVADAEGNGWSLSPNGTSAGAMLDPDTASSPATHESSDGAGTRKADPPAPTTGTKPGRRKARRSGS